MRFTEREAVQNCLQNSPKDFAALHDEFETLTGELIIAGTDKQWRKMFATKNADELIKRWKKTI